uniref:Integrase catalytic domain-containing protein n=1 Tax=Timema genevievae TaxID=629358 RepID=A0A7R9K0X4_TIMGE|nr:unnamed protein product [Timema genevievae]
MVLGVPKNHKELKYDALVELFDKFFLSTDYVLATRFKFFNASKELEENTALEEVPPSQFDVAFQRFILDYRNAPHATTGISPAQPLMGRQLSNCLDLLRPPPTSNRVQQAQDKQREAYGGVSPNTCRYSVGDQVWVKE